MSLLPGWTERLDGSEEAASPIAALPLDIARASADVRVIETADDSRRFAWELRATPLSALALSFGPRTPQDALCWDVRFSKPTALAIAAWAHRPGQGGTGTAVCAVLSTNALAAVGEILHLRLPAIFHDAKPALFAMWALGLDPDLPALHDTYLAAACLHLGSHHRRSRRSWSESEFERICAEQGLVEEKAHLLSLEGQCARYGIPAPFTARARETEPRVLASQAEAALRLYAAQQPDLVRHGLTQHLAGVEFPFAIANARMEWRGVHVAPDDGRRLLDGCRRATEEHTATLRSLGVEPAGSFQSLCSVLRRDGVEPPGSAEDRALRGVDHPAIRPFLQRRRFIALARADWCAGPDGRVHPEHVQLAAATGRNGCRNPALAGISRSLRPVVTASPGRGLVELDYSQIEVGVAAAEHGDQNLLAAFNSGDVYAAAAQRFYEDDLTDEERQLAPDEFRRRRPALRDAMKTFVLGVIYNLQAPALAKKFQISTAEARRQRERFLALYRDLSRGLEEAADLGAARGYASIVSGLRRNTDPDAPEGWQRNWLRNTPIQGGAAVVFKQALIELDRAFRGTDTWLVMQVHDSVLIECPLGEIEAVAERAAQIMRDAVRRWYPALLPRIDMNRERPTCWNNKGDAESLDLFFVLQQFDWLPAQDDTAVWSELRRWFITAMGAGAHVAAEREVPR